MTGRKHLAGATPELMRCVNQAAHALSQAEYRRIRHELVAEVREMLLAGRGHDEVQTELLQRELQALRR